MNDVSKFRERLFKQLEKNVQGLSGADVVKALKETSDELWCAGIDKAYGDMGNAAGEPLADAFDITWLTVLNVKLKRKQVRRKRKR